MQNYKRWFSGVIAVSVLALGAMNLSSVGSRSAGYASYDRLLSKHYKRIAALEAEIGTYKHYRYFSDKADTIIGNHNPRPLTVRGGRAIRNMRRDLERAMVGYEMRHNPEAVAGMHAAFECHVLNGNINSRLDQRCLKAYDTFKAKAEKSVDDARLQVAQMQPVHHNMYYANPQRSQPVLEPAQQGTAPEIKSIDYMSQEQSVAPAPAKVKYAPIAPMAPVADKSVPVMPKVSEAVVTPPQTDIPKIEAPKVEAPKIEAPKITPPQIEAPVPEAPSIDTPSVETPKLDVPEVPNVQEEKPFNPLDYVHPRLRKAAGKVSQNNAIPQLKKAMPQFAKLSAPPKKLPVPTAPSAQKSPAFVEGKVTKPTQNLSPIRPHSFGIKPLGETRVPKTPLFSPLNMGTSTSKIDMSMFDNKDNVKVTPHPRFVNETLKASPEVTSSALDRSGMPVDRYVVSFSGGGTRLSQSALREIQQIETKLQNSAYSKIRFIGHADKGGSASVNRALSFERAARVHDALENIIKFSDIEKTSIDGLGDTRPVKAFRPEDDRNRRVVVELVR